jgi:hypothetical protein
MVCANLESDGEGDFGRLVNKFEGGSWGYLFAANASDDLRYIGETDVNSDDSILDYGTWHHFAITANSGTVIFYRDAVEIGGGTIADNPVTNNNVLSIGNNQTLNRTADGILDNIRIWQTDALTQEEIEEYYLLDFGIDSGGETGPKRRRITTQ